MEEKPTITPNITEQVPVMQTPEVRWDGYAKQLDHTEGLIKELESGSDPLKNEKITQNMEYLGLIKGKLQALLDDIDLIEAANAIGQDASVETAMINNIPKQAQSGVGIPNAPFVPRHIPNDAVGNQGFLDAEGWPHSTQEEAIMANQAINDNRTR